MKDHQLGYVPAALDEFKECYVTPYPLGMPLRVQQEYEDRINARRKEEIAAVNYRYRMNEVRVLWRSMTDGDRDGLMARGDVNPHRVKQLSQGKPHDRMRPLSQRGPVLGGMPVTYAPVTDKWKQIAQAQAQQNDAQNAYTDGLIGLIKQSLQGPK